MADVSMPCRRAGITVTVMVIDSNLIHTQRFKCTTHALNFSTRSLSPGPDFKLDPRASATGTIRAAGAAQRRGPGPAPGLRSARMRCLADCGTGNGAAATGSGPTGS